MVVVGGVGVVGPLLRRSCSGFQLGRGSGEGGGGGGETTAVRRRG